MTDRTEKGYIVRSRVLVALCAVGLMAAGTGGVLAAGGGGSSDSSAAKSEYKPGVGPCKNGGTNPSGTHTGAPGNGQNCQTKTTASANSGSACTSKRALTIRLVGTKKLRRLSV